MGLFGWPRALVGRAGFAAARPAQTRGSPPRARPSRWTTCGRSNGMAGTPPCLVCSEACHPIQVVPVFQEMAIIAACMARRCTQSQAARALAQLPSTRHQNTASGQTQPRPSNGAWRRARSPPSSRALPATNTARLPQGSQTAIATPMATARLLALLPRGCWPCCFSAKAAKSRMQARQRRGRRQAAQRACQQRLPRLRAKSPRHRSRQTPRKTSARRNSQSVQSQRSASMPPDTEPSPPSPPASPQWSRRATGRRPAGPKRQAPQWPCSERRPTKHSQIQQGPPRRRLLGKEPAPQLSGLAMPTAPRPVGHAPRPFRRRGPGPLRPQARAPPKPSSGREPIEHNLPGRLLGQPIAGQPVHLSGFLRRHAPTTHAKARPPRHPPRGTRRRLPPLVLSSTPNLQAGLPPQGRALPALRSLPRTRMPAPGQETVGRYAAHDSAMTRTQARPLLQPAPKIAKSACPPSTAERAEQPPQLSPAPQQSSPRAPSSCSTTVSRTWRRLLPRLPSCRPATLLLGLRWRHHDWGGSSLPASSGSTPPAQLPQQGCPSLPKQSRQRDAPRSPHPRRSPRSGRRPQRLSPTGGAESSSRESPTATARKLDPAASRLG
mmetsp:Transcript_4717/g.20154  ORF Transcript_4717/g.20154 Transcript_4717/m.20154 type:complete len:607 (+) Transcript_4717:3552-5372(+)